MNLASQNNLPERLIIFDGVCNLCNASSNFIIQRDPLALFSFTTVQGATGTHLLSELGVDPTDPTTFVLIKSGVVFLKSNAAVEIAKELTGLWPLVAYLGFIPLFIRDPIYRFIARNRYKIMGKRDACMIPTPEYSSRFID